VGIFRVVLIVFATAIAISVALYFLTNRRVYLAWAGKLFKVGIVAALLFFVVLLLEKIV
jgi:hypothetical protein